MKVKDLHFRIVKKKNNRGTYAVCGNDNCKCNTPFIYGSEAQSRLGEYELQDCQIELFTGMTDFNGKKMYVGDIVEWSNFSEKVGVIVCDNDGTSIFRFGVKIYEKKTSEIIDCLSLENMNNHCRIIGNIHDNSELLGGKK